LWLADDAALQDYVYLLSRLNTPAARALFGSAEFRTILGGPLAEEYLRPSLRAEQVIEIRLSSAGNYCSIDDAQVACSELGGKLKLMRVPADAHIYLRGDSGVGHALMHTAFESLAKAGYSTNVVFVTH